MLGKLFGRSRTRKLEKAYRAKLEEAQRAQQAGDMPRYAELSAEAERIGEDLDRARAESS